MRILWIPSHLLAGGWFAAKICIRSRPVPEEDLENNQHSHTTNLILGLVFDIMYIEGPHLVTRIMLSSEVRSEGLGSRISGPDWLQKSLNIEEYNIYLLFTILKI